MIEEGGMFKKTPREFGVERSSDTSEATGDLPPLHHLQ